jgi:hypothetical protein
VRKGDEFGGEFIGGGSAWRERRGEFGANKMAVKGWSGGLKRGSCAGSRRRRGLRNGRMGIGRRRGPLAALQLGPRYPVRPS